MHQVLAVSHDPEKHALLRSALDRSFLIHHLEGEDLCLRNIVDTIVEKNIDLVVLDADLNDLCGMAVLESLQADTTTSEVPVVMLTCARMDSQSALALNRGAADCLALPCSTMLVQARIRRVCRSSDELSHTNEGSRLVAFVGAKGGVGTTTVTVNAGVALAERGLQTTLVDLHGFFGTMASQLGVYPSDHPHNIAELFDQPTGAIDHEAVERLLIDHSSGVRFLLGSQDGDRYHRVTADLAEALVCSLRGHADYTLFDLPPWPTEAVEVVLQNCDQVLLVLEREPASLQAAKALLSTLTSDGLILRDVGAVVVNRSALSVPIPLDYLRKNLSCPIVAMIPPAPDACAAATMSREPLIQFRHDADCAQALEVLAKNLTKAQLPALAF